MGYYVEILESTFRIPAENLDAAYEAMCQLNYTTKNRDKGGRRGGSQNYEDCGPHPDWWFSWMDWNYHETCADAEAILEELGFETLFDDEGNLLIQYFNSKTGQEDVFLDAISLLSVGYIVWRGEEGEIWGETYGGPSVVRKQRRNPPDYSDIVTY